MLKRLTIKNFAIISSADVFFENGFTVLTGATGAGKSLVIDSLSLLLGMRASTEMIRTGEAQAIVRGEFELETNLLKSLLSAFPNVPNQEGTLVVERTISHSKSVVKINGQTVPLSTLQIFAKALADIHDQFDFQRILNPENYLALIDGFDDQLISPLLSDYQSKLSSFKQKENELKILCSERDKIRENKDFYEYQYKELDGADLHPDEDKEIAEELATLKNFDKIYSLSKEAREIIEGETFDRLYDLLNSLKNLSNLQPSYREACDALEDHYYALSDLGAELRRSFDRLDYSPERLDELNERDAELSRLKRKYRKDINELIDFRDHLRVLLGNESDIDNRIDLAERAVENARQSCLDSALSLQKARKSVAEQIERKLEKGLKDLRIDARFSVVFFQNSPIAFYDNGIDLVDFLIETNAGEGLKSLSKVVSGGEASRIMLAFKEIFIKANHIPTVIFDEIDTGISGEAAEAVALKIQEISKFAQVIAITHLPQVAARSTSHILVEKHEESGRTFTSIKHLNHEEKIIEIGKLITDGKLTQKQLDYARELVDKN